MTKSGTWAPDLIYCIYFNFLEIKFTIVVFGF